MKNKIGLILFISMAIFLCGFRWPFDVGNREEGPHRITGSFGEFRPISDNFPTGRLHAGQDMNPSSTDTGQQAVSMAVIAIEEGNASVTLVGTNNEQVRIGRFSYVHIQVLIEENAPVTAGQVVGIIKNLVNETPHLHLAEFEDGNSTTQLDPVRPGGLDNFSDVIPPSVYPPTFHRHPQIMVGGGVTTQLDPANTEQTPNPTIGIPVIWEKIDIRARANDFVQILPTPGQTPPAIPTPSGSTLGLYEGGIAIEDFNSSPTTFILPPIYKLRFSHFLMSDTGALNFDNQGLIYDSKTSTVNSGSVTNPTISYYWLTSRLNSEEEDQPQDGVARNGFWNTKQKLQPTPDEMVDALINTQAAYADGRYRVWSLGKDIAGNGGDIPNSKGADKQDVLLDNFMPYVQSVAAAQGAVFYQASWPVTAQSATILGNLTFPVFTPVPTPSSAISVFVQFSEKMDTSVQPSLSFFLNNGIEKPVISPGHWLPDGQTWGVNAEAGLIPTDYRGNVALIIQGAKDLAGNFINFDPSSIPSRDSSGMTWISGSTGEALEEEADQSHFFQVGPDAAPYVGSVTVTQGALGTLVYGAIWTGQGSDQRVRQFSEFQPLDAGHDVSITVTFNQGMDPSFTPLVSLIPSDGGMVASECGTWVDPKTWETTISTAVLGSIGGSRLRLSISGAKSPDGNTLDADPGTVARLGVSGALINDEYGPDLTHSFGVMGSDPPSGPSSLVQLNSGNLQIWQMTTGEQGRLSGGYVWGWLRVPEGVDYQRSTFSISASYFGDWPIVAYAQGKPVSIGQAIPPLYGQGLTADFMLSSPRTICGGQVVNSLYKSGHFSDYFQDAPFINLGASSFGSFGPDHPSTEILDFSFLANFVFLPATQTPTATPTSTSTVTATPTLLDGPWENATNDGGFEPREDAQAPTDENGNVFLIGGHGSMLNDVWTSTDGYGWTRLLEHADFSPRYGHSSAYFNGFLWVMGGNDGVPRNDIWKSAGGTEWVQVNSGAVFSPRAFHRTAVFDAGRGQELWVVGGQDGTGSALGDVWHSLDGQNWVRSEDAPFPARYRHAMTVFAGKVWVIGGTNGTQLFNDIWWTSDGENWTPVPAANVFSPREGHSLMTFGNAMYLVAGKDTSGYQNDLWGSSDGSTWQRATMANNFLPRSGQASVEFKNALWVIGGNSGTLLSDVWFTPPPPIPTPTPTHTFTSTATATPTSSPSPTFTQTSTPTDVVQGVRLYLRDTSENLPAFGKDLGSAPLSGPSRTAVTPPLSGLLYSWIGGPLNVEGFGDGPWTFRLWSHSTLPGASYILVVYEHDGTAPGNILFVSEPVDVPAGPSTVLVKWTQTPGPLAFTPGNRLYLEIYTQSANSNLELAYNSPQFDSSMDVPFGVTGGATPTSSFTDTWTATFTETATGTPTFSPTWTTTDTSTSTETPSLSPTLTDTATGTPTITNTWTSTSTETATDTSTLSPTLTATDTLTSTVTPTSTVTLTDTATATSTYTDTWTPTPTLTATETPTPSSTETLTSTLTSTDTTTSTATTTSTDTATSTFTWTPTPIPTGTSTATRTSTSSSTLTKTQTSTSTWTKTPTSTRTPTATFTPTPPLVCVGTLTNPKLNLQVSCFQQDSQQERLHVRITNWGSGPVTLNKLSIKMWVNESQLVNMGQWVQFGQICHADGSNCSNVNGTGFNAAASWLQGTCTVDSTHKANQVVVFTTDTNSQSIQGNGGYWDQGFDLGIGRSNNFMDDEWADDYSKTSTCPSGLVDDSHFALYYNGTLLKEWTSSSNQDPASGAEPCCGGNFSGSLLAPPPSALSPTAGPKDRDLVEVIPNLSRGGEPVRFAFDLGHPAIVHLGLFTLTGELVLGKDLKLEEGPQEWTWDLRNDSARKVASGLYLYLIRWDEGGATFIKKGKIAVLR